MGIPEAILIFLGVWLYIRAEPERYRDISKAAIFAFVFSLAGLVNTALLYLMQYFLRSQYLFWFGLSCSSLSEIGFVLVLIAFAEIIARKPKVKGYKLAVLALVVNPIVLFLGLSLLFCLFLSWLS